MASDLKHETADLDVGGETPGCPACPHPWDDHDRIAARFCAATTDRHFDRGCVCTANHVPKPTIQRR
ncbi:MAG: hypothetical protein GEU97_11050 [Actinophytocola sp.]|nr:hypothetical protein [Actinophytocola sp.]